MIRSPEGESAKHRQNSDHKNPGVDSDVSGLQSRPHPADAPGESSASIDEEAVDQTIVDDPPEKVARESVRRQDDRAIERLVDEILVGDHPFETFFGCRVTFAWDAIRFETRNREHDARDRNYYRRADECLFSRRWQLLGAGSDARCSRSHHRIEPVPKQLPGTKRHDVSDYLWQIEPPAKYCEYPQNHQGPCHDPRRLVQVLLFLRSGAHGSVERVEHQPRHVDRGKESGRQSDSIDDIEQRTAGDAQPAC